MAKTLRTRIREGWETVARKLTSDEIDDNFLALEDAVDAVEAELVPGLSITEGKTLTVTDDTTITGGTHSGTNTGDQASSDFEISSLTDTFGKRTSWDAKAAGNHLHTGVYEPVLGTPSSGTKLLASTSTGTRSWVDAPSGTGGITSTSVVEIVVTTQALYDALDPVDDTAIYLISDTQKIMFGGVGYGKM